MYFIVFGAGAPTPSVTSSRTVNELQSLIPGAPEAKGRLPMPSMVLVGDLGSHWGPPVAFGGPQMASNTCIATNGSRTVRGNGSGRWCAAPTCAPLAELSLPTTEGTYGTLTAAPGARTGLCGGLNGCKRAPPNRSSNGSFPSNRAGGMNG